MNRREFITNIGAVVATGTVAATAGCTNNSTNNDQVETSTVNTHTATAAETAIGTATGTEQNGGDEAASKDYPEITAITVTEELQNEIEIVSAVTSYNEMDEVLEVIIEYETETCVYFRPEVQFIGEDGSVLYTGNAAQQIDNPDVKHHAEIGLFDTNPDNVKEIKVDIGGSVRSIC